MIEQYVLAEYEAQSGTDTFHIADLIQEENRDLQMELVDSGLFVLWTDLTPEQVQQLVWKHNSGLWCEAKVIDEDQYDALC